MYPGDMSVEARIPEATRQALIARGHKLRVDAGLGARLERGDCSGCEHGRAQRGGRSAG